MDENTSESTPGDSDLASSRSMTEYGVLRRQYNYYAQHILKREGLDCITTRIIHHRDFQNINWIHQENGFPLILGISNDKGVLLVNNSKNLRSSFNSFYISELENYIIPLKGQMISHIYENNPKTCNTRVYYSPFVFLKLLDLDYIFIENSKKNKLTIPYYQCKKYYIYDFDKLDSM